MDTTLTLIARADDSDFTVPVTPAMTILWSLKRCQVWWTAYVPVQVQGDDCSRPTVVAIRERSEDMNGDTTPKAASKIRCLDKIWGYLGLFSLNLSSIGAQKVQAGSLEGRSKSVGS